MINKLLLKSVSFVFLAISASHVQAETQRLYLEVDESQMLTLPSSPGTIVIGNPSIADVSIQGKQIFLHGKGFGQTTLSILDLEGNQLASFILATTHNQSDSVYIYRSALGGVSRYSYTCVPKCETEFQIGDNSQHLKDLKDQMEGKFELATGNKSAEALAPQAPQ
jgi:hypothetical protein